MDRRLVHGLHCFLRDYADDHSGVVDRDTCLRCVFGGDLVQFGRTSVGSQPRCIWVYMGIRAIGFCEYVTGRNSFGGSICYGLWVYGIRARGLDLMVMGWDYLWASPYM